MMRHEFTSEGGRSFSVIENRYASASPSVWLEADNRTVDPDSFGDVLLREIVRLAIARESAPESLPDGSRGFEHGGKRWKIKLSPPRVLEEVIAGRGAFCLAGEDTPGIPPFEVLAEQFAALGREQEAARIEPLLRQARDEAARLREESQRNAENYAKEVKRLFEERDTARREVREMFAERNASRDRISELGAEVQVARAWFRRIEPMEAEVEIDLHGTARRFGISIGGDGCLTAKDQNPRRPDNLGWLPVNRFTGDTLRGLLPHFVRLAIEQTELDSRAEVADLLARLEDQKARAERIKRCAVAASEAMNEEWTRAEAAERRLADLESRQAATIENITTGMLAAVRARTEGDPRRIVGMAHSGRGLVVWAADGTAWERIFLHGEPGEWEQLPSLPAAETEPAGRARRTDGGLRCVVCGVTYDGLNWECGGAPAEPEQPAEGRAPTTRHPQFDDYCPGSNAVLSVTGAQAESVRCESCGRHLKAVLNRAPHSPYVYAMPYHTREDHSREAAESAPIEANRPEPEGESLGPRSFAADVPACWLPDALSEALRQAVSDYGVRIPAHGEPTCSRCGFWAGTKGLPEMPVCAKCYHDIEAERGA